MERTALVAAGLFDEALRRGQDFDMWVRLAAAGARFSYTTEPLVYRRIHTMNLSGDRLTELERAAAVYTRLRAKISFGPAAARALDAQLRLLHADIHAERGKRDLAAGGVVDAAKHFREAAGAGWKVQFVNLALRIAPRATRHAYVADDGGGEGRLRQRPGDRQMVVKPYCPPRNPQLTSPTLPRNLLFLRSSDDEQAS